MLWQVVRLGVGTATLLGGGWLLRAMQGAPAALGAGPLAVQRVAGRSPQYRDGVFVNAEPDTATHITREQQLVLLREVLGGSATTRPPRPVPLVVPADVGVPPGRLAATWYGHSSAMVEVDGYRVLADPVWSDRCSPSRIVGPERMHPVPTELAALPALDAVVISHDHYDHLDIDTVTALAHSQRCSFYVPLGVGAHLREWDIPDERIVELDWHESARVDELTITCTPARHFSGRFLTRNTTLWSSWVVAGPRHRAFFGGDTGYTPAFADIGARYGPFDLTLLPVGAYHPAWPDIHMNPEEAVRAHRDLTDAGDGLFVPIHWATFRLAPHRWAEPVDRLLAAAAPGGVPVAVPRPGERVEPGQVGELTRWWR